MSLNLGQALRAHRRPFHLAIARASALVPDWVQTAHMIPWLSAPIAGRPLMRRILETFVGCDVQSLHLDLSRKNPSSQTGIAQALNQDIEPCFGMSTEPLLTWTTRKRGDDDIVAIYRPGSIDPTALRVALISQSMEQQPTVQSVHNGEGGLLLCPARAISNATMLEDLLSASPQGWQELLPHQGSEWKTLQPGVGSALDLLRLAQESLHGEPGLYSPFGQDHGGLLLGPGARIHRKAQVLGRCAVGAGSYVAPHATLHEGAVIGRNCYIGTQAHIKDAIVLDGTRIVAGELVRHCVRIGPHVYLGGVTRDPVVAIGSVLSPNWSKIGRHRLDKGETG